MRSVKDLVKRGLEGCRTWKKRWKILLLLGIVLLVAAGLFFAIPNPYRDAWDDLFLPYPEEFPEPGVYKGSIDNWKILTRAETISRHEIADTEFERRSYKLPDYSIQFTTFVGIVKLINYVDVVFWDKAYCLAVCKVEKVIAQRENMTKDGDIITVMFRGSSKIKTMPHGELSVKQNLMVALSYSNDVYFNEWVTPKDSKYCVTDYCTGMTMSDTYVLPVRKNVWGQYYVDLSDTYEKYYYQRSNKQLFPENAILNKRIEDLDAYGEFWKENFNEVPYSVFRIDVYPEGIYKNRLMEE